MDDATLYAALDLIAKKQAGEIHPAVLKQIYEKGLADHSHQPPELTEEGQARLKQLSGH